jgi:GMP synthase-like glutamine amidotransferase
LIAQLLAHAAKLTVTSGDTEIGVFDMKYADSELKRDALFDGIAESQFKAFEWHGM